MKRQTAQRDGRRRGEGVVGRGCCTRCFTPWMCARPLGSQQYPPKEKPCNCHHRKIPVDSRIEEIRLAILEKRNQDT